MIRQKIVRKTSSIDMKIPINEHFGQKLTNYTIMPCE